MFRQTTEKLEGVLHFKAEREPEKFGEKDGKKKENEN